MPKVMSTILIISCGLSYLSFSKFVNFKEKIFQINFLLKNKSTISVLFCLEFADPSQSINLPVNL